MKYRHIIGIFLGCVGFFILIAVLANTHHVAAVKTCDGPGLTVQYECSATLDPSKNLWIQNLEYRKSTTNNYHYISYWDYTAFIEIDSSNWMLMPYYNYNEGGESTAMTPGYQNGDHLAQGTLGTYCYYIESYLVTTINGIEVDWYQDFDYCDQHNGNVQITWGDSITFQGTTTNYVFVHAYHRSWSQPAWDVSTTSEPFVAYYDLTSATWKEPRNEVAFSAQPTMTVNEKIKMKTTGSNAAVYYGLEDGMVNTVVNTMQVNIRGITDSYPWWSLMAHDTRDQANDVWWCYTGDAPGSYYPSFGNVAYYNIPVSNWPG